MSPRDELRRLASLAILLLAAVGLYALAAAWAFRVMDCETEPEPITFAGGGA